VTNLPFNRVVIEESGQQRSLTLGEFLELPLHLRISYILGRRLQFFDSSILVSPRVALKALRAVEYNVSE
jgi:hypothetical protein